MLKKIITIVIVAFLAIATPLQSIASNLENTTVATSDKEASTTRSTVLLNRINEIKAMDRSGMSSFDRKELRSELKSMKKEMKHERNGVYLSLGAIIIIVLLLIILL